MKNPENKGVFEKRYRVGILTSPAEQASVAPISNLIEILKPISKSLVIITGNASYDYFKNDISVLCFDNGHPIHRSRVKRLFHYIQAQFRGSHLILKQRNEVDLWFFFMGGEREFIPILTAKLIKKPSLLILTGSIVKTATYSRDPFFLPIKLLNWITCASVNGIILNSPRLISDAGLEKHKTKIFIAQRHFVDLELFQCSKKFEKRLNIIGYIGRLSKEKGVLNFVNAISRIHSENPQIQFFIGGDGILHDQITTSISSSRLNEKVTCVGWIPHDELPTYLNRLKLLVLPSYTEGLPNIMLEAMACGTPVLVTSVGAIADVIDNEKTGFILTDNSPQIIKNSVIQVLNHPYLEIIANNGKNYISSHFSFQKSVESYAHILAKFLSSKQKITE